MAVQTEVALQNIGYVSDLGPHMKVAWADLKKSDFVLFRLSYENQIWVTFGQKSQIWATLACSVN